MRLGHINKDRISRLVWDNLLPNVGKVEYPVCEPCISEKMVKKPFPKGDQKFIITNHCSFRYIRTI